MYTASSRESAWLDGSVDTVLFSNDIAHFHNLFLAWYLIGSVLLRYINVVIHMHAIDYEPDRCL